MWVYEQATGVLRKDNIRCTGYSGHKAGKNRPSMQHAKNVGPIPVGLYSIGKSYNSPSKGPLCLPLTPDPSNVMFGRSAFLIHGDSVAAPGEASHGCIIMPRWMRELIDRSEDKQLMVVSESQTSEGQRV